jgi:hypothetical protein
MLYLERSNIGIVDSNTTQGTDVSVFVFSSEKLCRMEDGTVSGLCHCPILRPFPKKNSERLRFKFDCNVKNADF